MSYIAVFPIIERQILLFELPDCFWTMTYLVRTMELYSVFIRGNDSVPNPFARLPTTINTFNMEDCVLVDPTQGTAYKADLEPIASWPSLSTVGWKGNNFGGASLPSRLPPSGAPGNLRIVSCHLGGSIPSNFLDNWWPISIDLSDNELIGFIPDSLFANLTTSPSDLTLDLHANQLSGTLPPNLFHHDSLRPALFHVDLSQNQLSGSLPNGFLPQATYGASAFLNVSFNQLSGTIPAGFATTYFLTNLTSPNFQALSLFASNNNLTGSVPAFFGGDGDGENAPGLSPTDARFLFQLDLSHNQFTSISLGIIPNASWTMASAEYNIVPSILLNLNFNQIQGTIPSGFLDSNAPLLYAGLNHNQLSGSIPEHLLGELASTSNLAVSLGHNALSGTLPSNFFSSLTLSSLDFDISYNPGITGFIPSSLSHVMGSSSLPGSVYVNMSHCALSGTLPSLLLSPQLSEAVFNFESNNLVGSSSGVFNISSFISLGQLNDYQLSRFGLNLANNQFGGALELDGETVPDNLYYRDVALNVSYNRWSSINVGSSWGSVFSSFDISHNPSLKNASFSPSGLFSSGTLITLNASNTGLTGILPSMGRASSSLTQVDLSNNSLDFCGGTRTAWTNSLGSLVYCNLTFTNANLCPELYPSVCLFSPVPPSPPVAPTAPSSPSSTPGAPNTTPHRGPTGDVARNLVSSIWMAIALIAIASLM